MLSLSLISRIDRDLMSSRKPRSVIIRDDDDFEEGLSETVPLKATKNKVKRNKFKVRSNFEKENASIFHCASSIRGASNELTSLQDREEDEDIDSINITMKNKDPKKRKGLSIPLFQHLDDEKSTFGIVKHDIEDLKRETDFRKSEKHTPSLEDGPVVVELPEETPAEQCEAIEESDFIPLEEGEDKGTRHVTFDTQEYISVLSPGAQDVDEDEEENTEMNEEAYYELDDGRLPLSDRQAALQKKMHDMEIKDALYDVEISEDEEMTDWTASKMKQGGLGGAPNVPVMGGKGFSTLPKLNLLGNETFETQKKHIEDMMSALTGERENIEQSLEKLEQKKALYDDELSVLKQRLEEAGYGL